MKVTNRELLRNYKMLKEKLLNGEVAEIRIPQSGNVVLKLSIERKTSEFNNLLEKINNSPVILERPEEDII